MPTFRFNRRPAARSFAGNPKTRGSIKIRLVIALVIAGFALLSYCSSSEYNEILDKHQRVALTTKQEIALGLQALPQMLEQYGGLLPDLEAQQRVDRVGAKLLGKGNTRKSHYQFEFHVLNDPQTINAFALPGGQIFITQALLEKFDREDQLAGVLAHEIGHVVARHAAQQMAKQQLSQGLSGAVVVGTGEYAAGQMAQAIGGLVNMKYGRDDEIESDILAVRLLNHAGYDPFAMIEVMEILASAGGTGGEQPEFFSTHPNPENRIERIRQAIESLK